MGLLVASRQHGTLTKDKVQERTQTKKPPMYKVLLLNDDYTPMDFVIVVLRKFYLKSPTEAEQIMLQVHKEGSGVAGIYPYEIAEAKVVQTNQFAKTHQHPLKCIMETT